MCVWAGGGGCTLEVSEGRMLFVLNKIIFKYSLHREKGIVIHIEVIFLLSSL